MKISIIINSNSLLGIVNDILDFSKMEAGKLILHDSDFDIIELVEKTFDIFSEVNYCVNKGWTIPNFYLCLLTGYRSQKCRACMFNGAAR